MFINRIIGALTFRKGVYAEVERDQSFTQTAWILVAVVAFFSALGSSIATAQGIGSILIATIISMVFAIIGFALGAFVISWVGKTLFNADVDFGEVVRVVGLAYIWQIAGVLAFIPGLGCVIGIVTTVLFIIAWLIAVKEALDLDWGRTIVAVVLAWIVNFIVISIAGLILGAMGFAAAGIMGAFGQ